MVDPANYRLAFVLPRTRQLVALPANGAYVFPRVSVSPGERAAQQLSHRIKSRWNIQSIVLDLIADDRPESPCAVIEVRSLDWDPLTSGFVNVELDAVSDESLLPAERDVLHSILSGSDAGRGPFSRIEWIEDVYEWFRQSNTPCGAIIGRDTLQLSAGGRFCLIRIATSSGKGYWLKATGEPNSREFGITVFLSKNYPQYLPRIVATCREWNAWLMEEHGSSLNHSMSLEAFQEAVRNMANLQKLSIGHSSDLMNISCGDHRIHKLISSIPYLIAYIDEAMAVQTSTKAPRLTSERLHAIEGLIHRACLIHQELKIPDTLIHSDINPGNILYDGVSCVFTDWCEANLGNPFIAAEQMRMHATKQSPEPALWARAMTEEYKSCWTELLTERQLELSFKLSPLLAIVSHLHDSCKWLDSPKRNDPERLSYARSLARHIDRMVEVPQLKEALCP